MAGARSWSTVAAKSTSTVSASTSWPARRPVPGSSRWSPRTARQVADGIEFPNGMVVTPDNSTLIIAESFAGRLTAFDIAAEGSLSNRRVWAELGGPGNGDDICLDADGAVWTPVLGNACARVREGGEVLQRIELDRPCYACMLGGPDRRTLFMMAAEWRGIENVDEVVANLIGQVLTAPAPAPGVGWP